MRESRRTERMQLPRDQYEVWLESQTPELRGFKHKKPPEDVYETWVKKLVKKNWGLKTKGKKTSPRAAA